MAAANFSLFTLHFFNGGSKFFTFHFSLFAFPFFNGGSKFFTFHFSLFTFKELEVLSELLNSCNS